MHSVDGAVGASNFLGHFILQVAGWCDVKAVLTGADDGVSHEFGFTRTGGALNANDIERIALTAVALGDDGFGAFDQGFKGRFGGVQCGDMERGREEFRVIAGGVEVRFYG